MPATLPRQRQWIPDHSTDLLGDLVETKNLNLDRTGYVELSAMPRASMDNSIDSDFDLPVAVIYSADYGFFIITSDDAFQIGTDLLATRPTQVTTTGVPAGDTEADVAWCGGLMVMTQDNDVDYYDPAANTWTDTNISLTSASSAGFGSVTQHQVVEFLSLSAIAIVNVNTVKLYAIPITATPTLITTLTIPSDFVITSAKYFNQNLYLGTANVYGGPAFMYVWNGQGVAAQQTYKIDSHTILSLEPHEGTIFVTSSSGALLKFLGSSFQVADAWPMYYLEQSLSDQNGNIPMLKNTMRSNGQCLYINFANSRNNNQALLNQPDGIWCYDSAIEKMYHRYSVTHAMTIYETIGAANINTTTDQLTVSNSYITGTEVVLTSAFTITPLVQHTKYYVIRVDATHIQLAETLADALAGNEIDITSVSGSHSFVFFPASDYGQFHGNRATMLELVQYPGTNKIYGVDVIFGGEADTRDGGGTDDVMAIPSDGIESRGYCVTRKILSSDVTDQNNQISLKFSKMISEHDQIIIKYRNIDDRLEFISEAGSDWDISWTSSNTFTATGTPWADAVVGDEVNVIRGAAGGLLAHITAIDGNTFTIDETFRQYASGDVSIAVFRNWKKWKTISYGDRYDEKGVFKGQLGKSGKFLQLKLEIRGIRVRLEELMVDNDYLVPAVN